ncbi:MAG: murein biosynthesis integral membrane protein MurJ [Candidatus Vogelbacteria bacterium CG22_combo_CG10-13_8_21_14_all_37_9]|uniref:Probable lipid II flippase MurJ n=1 Tax=Candidatus Vogelbacteria bacterium CG22_combo_CG10-13_8_21_14_all_37_9 TaxID=1975046 RepID=A0A2H0BKW0_9BACT|nr:MAG: murein biosynthesis integral membrane protein MurJ [bacterium CG10_37_50]PIP58315.1 MAG: murein biosynthesis integral membrane protein MurJ [Candidatus Vogelbacteria bacterium CG22_combo_CG10-13_8_21_14_all_37_9]
MVSKITRLLQKEFTNLHQAAFLLATSALLSQFLGLWRDRLLASGFGASHQLDIYYTAFRLPDLIYVSVASFVSITVHIPLIINKMETGGKPAVEKFLNSVLTVFLIGMVSVSALLFIFMPWLSKITAPGFSSVDQQTLVTLSRILLLSPLLLGLSNLLGGATQAFRKFAAYAFSPIFYNLGIIFGIFFFYPLLGLPGLVWGVILGAVLHLSIQLPVLSQLGLRLRLSRLINWPEMRKVMLISLPRTITLSANQLSLLVLVALASFLPKGSISVFNFSLNLQSVPLSIIGVSYSVAAFPVLAKFFVAGQHKEFAGEIIAAIRHIIFWSAPVVVLFIVLRAQIVRVILGSGRFDWSATRLTAACLAIFSVSVIAQSLILVLVRAYYAAGETKTPLIINSLSSLGTIILALILWQLFKVWPAFHLILEQILRLKDLPGTIILVLPLAFSIGAIINVFVLWWAFERRFAIGIWRNLEVVSLQSLVASLFGGFVAYNLLNVFSLYYKLDTFWSIFEQGFLAGILGLIAWISVLILLKSEELAELGRSLSARVWKVVPIVPEREEL